MDAKTALNNIKDLEKKGLEIIEQAKKEALDILRGKKNIRLLELSDITSRLPVDAYDFKKVSGGILIQNIDSSLAFRYSCRAGLCGVCILKVNGKACMSCHKIADKEMTIEPPSQYTVIKDLVVDFQKKKPGSKETEEEE